ncbi:hypothetical protein BGZ63DRAFT_409640 [Mariannaea sp. PMI_226]|nr:hypothetical protein BGZ63DRAFT_409640 [Mariannaea sp. PMI_226]
MGHFSKLPLELLQHITSFIPIRDKESYRKVYKGEQFGFYPQYQKIDAIWEEIVKHIAWLKVIRASGYVPTLIGNDIYRLIENNGKELSDFHLALVFRRTENARRDSTWNLQKTLRSALCCSQFDTWAMQAKYPGFTLHIGVGSSTARLADRFMLLDPKGNETTVAYFNGTSTELHHISNLKIEPAVENNRVLIINDNPRGCYWFDLCGPTLGRRGFRDDEIDSKDREGSRQELLSGGTT